MSGPGSGRVQPSVRRDGVFVFTPCHGVRVFVPLEDTLAGVHLSPVCPREGRQVLLELAADESAACGLRALWTDPDEEEAAR